VRIRAPGVSQLIRVFGGRCECNRHSTDMTDRDLTFMDLARGMRQVLRANREIRRAKKLSSEGRRDEAFAMAKPAFEVLTDLASRGNPQASSVLIFDAVFFAGLAEGVGQARTARSAVIRSKELCSELAPTSAKLAAQVEEHSAWYNAWLKRTEDAAGEQT
jgi:hypothetical protein